MHRAGLDGCNGRSERAQQPPCEEKEVDDVAWAEPVDSGRLLYRGGADCLTSIGAMNEVKSSGLTPSKLYLLYRSTTATRVHFMLRSCRIL